MDAGDDATMAGATAMPVAETTAPAAEEPAQAQPSRLAAWPASGGMTPGASPAPAPAPVMAPPPPAPAPTPAPAPVAAALAVAVATESRALPKVQSFELPVTELAEVANSSGLQWVNSDAGKIAATQAAIAAEPKPIHVPRQRPAAVVIDERQLVLVETKRDLRNMTLPFEQQTPPQ